VYFVDSYEFYLAAEVIVQSKKFLKDACGSDPTSIVLNSRLEGIIFPSLSGRSFQTNL